jgi:hypothetical protein
MRKRWRWTRGPFELFERRNLEYQSFLQTRLPSRSTGVECPLAACMVKGVSLAEMLAMPWLISEMATSEAKAFERALTVAAMMRMFRRGTEFGPRVEREDHVTRKNTLDCVITRLFFSTFSQIKRRVQASRRKGCTMSPR